MLKLEAYALTDVGRKRDHNEDFLGDLLLRPESREQFSPAQLHERGQLFAVADGMGGHASGEVASKMAIITLFERYYNAPVTPDLAGTLAQAVSAANRDVRVAGYGAPGGFMGTTLTLALFKDNRALIGNVGDSRTYLLRQGELSRITRDHSLVQEQIDMGLLSANEVGNSKVKNVITRAIGHKTEVDTDFFELELEAGDTFLLCSDGLHGPVPENEIAAIITGADTLQTAAEQLVKRANEAGGPDNISALLVRVEQVGQKMPPFLAPPTRVTSPTDKTDPIIPLVKDNPAADGGSPPPTMPLKVEQSAPTEQIARPAGVWPAVPPGSPYVPTPAPPPVTAAPPKVAKKARKLLWVALGGSLAGVVIIVAAVLLFLNAQSSNNQTVAASAPVATAPVAGGAAPVTVANAATTSSATTPDQSQVQRVRLVVVAPARPFVVLNLFEPGSSKAGRFEFKGPEQSTQPRLKEFSYEATFSGKASAGTYRIKNEAGTFEADFTLDPFKFDCNNGRCNFSTQSQLLDNGATLEIKLTPNTRN